MPLDPYHHNLLKNLAGRKSLWDRHPMEKNVGNSRCPRGQRLLGIEIGLSTEERVDVIFSLSKHLLIRFSICSCLSLSFPECRIGVRHWVDGRSMGQIGLKVHGRMVHGVGCDWYGRRSGSEDGLFAMVKVSENSHRRD